MTWRPNPTLAAQLAAMRANVRARPVLRESDCASIAASYGVPMPDVIDAMTAERMRRRG